MSTTTPLNPPSQRYPFESEIADLPPGLQQAHRYAFNGLVDVNQAIVALKSQVDANKTSITSAATAATNTNTSSETVIISSNTVGVLNDQTGNTAYTTGQVDAGAFILFSDASPIAVSLSGAGTSPGITLPWFCTIINEGVGLITVTPAVGLISYPGNLSAANMTIPQFFAATIVYDGSNFYAVIYCVPPANTPLVTHEWLNSFNQITGIFGQSQPAFTDISGIATPSQIPALSALTGQITESQLPSAGLTGTVTLAALTGGGTQGSISYTNGIITAVVDPT